MSKYIIDVFTKQSVRLSSPENSYEAGTPEEVNNIINNVLKTSGFREVQIQINEPDTDNRDAVDTEKEQKIPEQIRHWFRKVMDHPDGAIVHDGDCSIFCSKICDCGLLRNLFNCEVPEKWYEKFWEEYPIHIDRTEPFPE